MSEREVQREIVSALRKCGYSVWVTSDNRAAHGTRGCPDLIVATPSQGPGVCLALEVKGEKTRLSPEQQAQAERGEIIVVRSTEEALLALGKRDLLCK